MNSVFLARLSFYLPSLIFQFAQKVRYLRCLVSHRSSIISSALLMLSSSLKFLKLKDSKPLRFLKPHIKNCKIHTELRSCISRQPVKSLQIIEITTVPNVFVNDENIKKRTQDDHCGHAAVIVCHVQKALEINSIIQKVSFGTKTQVSYPIFFYLKNP